MNIDDIVTLEMISIGMNKFYPLDYEVKNPRFWEDCSVYIGETHENTTVVFDSYIPSNIEGWYKPYKLKKQ